MTPELTLERALTRYADQIYRIALLGDPRPARAAKATARAFKAADWTAVHLDETLEPQLIAALPRSSQRRQPKPLAPLPADFWLLPATTRVALGLRLARGYATDAIGAMLDKNPDNIRQELLDALTGGSEPNQSRECHLSRLSSLDDARSGRIHRLSCEACRTAMAHIGKAETTLARAIEEATAGLHLPARTRVEIADAVRGRGMRAPMSMWQQHLVRIGMVVVATLAITAALVIQRPHSEPPAQTQPPATARDLLAKAIAQYGVPLKGEGIIHQHVEINTGQPDVTVIADAWTDGANPARHRMQITVNNALQEWQAGDGQGSLRYVSSGILQSCGRNYPDSRVPVGQINRWSMSDADQAAMRRARWQFGPWATGRRYLEQAQAAEQLRSLGVAVEDGYRVLTIAAEGPTINGTLLLKLDVDNLTLHEVREVLIDQGATSTRVPWKVGSIEHLDKVDATSSGVLDNYPAQPRPQEYDRPMPILDPACPLWDTDHAHSLTSTISQGITPVVGLTQVPPEIERIYLAGRRRAGGSTNGEDDYLRLIYVGGGKRLTLLALPDLAARPARVATPSEWVAAGPWLVRIHSAGLGTVRGDALPAGSQPDPSAFWFVAEGWTEPEVLALLSGAHRLDLRDVTAQRSLIYDPGMTPATAGASIDGS